VKREVELFLFFSQGSAAPVEDSPLSPDEYLRARRMGHQEVRNQFIVGRTVLRELLAERLSVAPRDVEVALDKQGRPYLEGHESRAFSISHSGPYIAIALGWGYGTIGVDIERFRADLPARRLARRFFEPEAAAAVVDSPNEAEIEIFLRYWTVKEAVLKALGTGLRTPLRQVEIEADLEWTEGRCSLASCSSQNWTFFQWRREGTWVLSLALEGKVLAPRPELQEALP